MYNKSLDTFIAVADTGSFAKAADKLFISNTAVMKQMNQLEASIGLKLFNRTNHGIKLTEPGISLYNDSKKIIAMSYDAISHAKSLVDNSSYTLRVGTSFLNPCKVIMDLWSKINSIYPQFQLQIVPFDDNHDSILNVIDSIGKKIDIIAGTGSSKLWQTKCNYHILSDFKLCCAVSRKHPLASKKVLEISDLNGQTLMMCKRGDCTEIDSLRDYLETAFPDIKIEDTPFFYDLGVFNQCEQSNNILLSLPQWNEIHPGLITLPVNWEFTNTFGLLYPKHPAKYIIDFLNAINGLD